MNTLKKNNYNLLLVLSAPALSGNYCYNSSRNPSCSGKIKNPIFKSIKRERFTFKNLEHLEDCIKSRSTPNFLPQLRLSVREEL
ncbi:hypothetical protein CEXT_157531 [Caerostris extrusa]|uniref:Secreted protein n=1 Tax=Caerostris extrusa TaxID=172846 RepID=A0AAV4SF87_CAEEX|nr:hypothetical protein CEXT_157531 [Caerostris extrusa]